MAGNGLPPRAMYVIIACFVLCGTFSTMSGKLLFQCTSQGLDGTTKTFTKPLFQNTGMFFGMTLCLGVYFYHFYNAKKRAGEAAPLLGGKNVNQVQEVKGSDPRIYYIVAVPAICDFVATYMMNVGLLWINASVWQMVRGSIVLFTALIRWGWLKKKIFNYQWFGVGIVMFALCIIGYSAILGEGGDEQDAVPMNNKIFGVLLVFFAQMVQATQAVVEEHLLHNVNANAMQVVGLEGLWGLILCVAISMPIAYNIPTPGLHEDTWDTLTMIKNNPGQIMPILIVYCLVILGFNIFAMKITEAINSVTRSVLDTVRTIFIWFFMTLLHYTVSPTMGEPWNSWCWLQLAGFGVLIFGLFTYYQVFTLPYFEYPDDESMQKDPQLATPTFTPRGGARRRLSSLAAPTSPALLLTPGSPRR
jgi:drug/metabolite transporter (DMT)-like permease